MATRSLPHRMVEDGKPPRSSALLAISAPIVMVSIWCGVWLGLTYMLEGSVKRGFRSLFNWS